jgi:integrase/recombinase XerD
MTPPTINFPALVQDFFQRRLAAERAASAHTIASYRDAFALFLRYVEQRTGRNASALTLDDLSAPVVLTFLDGLESERGNCARTRNLRLTAIRSFMRYASVRDPTSLPLAQRVLAIATKRTDHPIMGFLSREEMQAVLDAPNRTTWSGHRDAVLFAVLYNTGARVSEVTRLHVADLLLDRAAAVHLRGKECHAYCISFRRRSETTGTHAGRQACDLAFSAANVPPVVRRDIAVGPYTDAHGAGRVAPMSEPWAA